MGNCRLSGLYKQSIIVFLSTLHSLFYKIHHSISIHAPRGGSDVSCFTRQPPCSIFLSTLPVGGATGSRPEIIPSIPISIHAPRGGSDEADPEYRQIVNISIHAPRGGSDSWITTLAFISFVFLSTLPVGGATSFDALIMPSVSFLSTLPVGGATKMAGYLS